MVPVHSLVVCAACVVALAPKPVTAQLCSAVGGVLGRPSWLPVSAFGITTLLGEGVRVRLCGAGF